MDQSLNRGGGGKIKKTFDHDTSKEKNEKGPKQGSPSLGSGEGGRKQKGSRGT